MGDAARPSRGLMPPALTQRSNDRDGKHGDGRLAPPFVGGPMSAAPASNEEKMPWEGMPDEGTVEPVFKADTENALNELTQNAKREEFPLDAFIIPEQTQRVPSGLEGQAVPATPTPAAVRALADHLEKLSHRLRVEEAHELLRRLASGDRLEAMLAGLIAGYLAGSE